MPASDIQKLSKQVLLIHLITKLILFAQVVIKLGERESTISFKLKCLLQPTASSSVQLNHKINTPKNIVL